ncbi:MAG TPA: hypothetical protein RMH99_10115 [Sandaracinaceae bacterium LLY-WYZ-13_1]|nr:hypothetical protein [Sandaracinaceae bacterium LLY-WYZ-13_1]
MRTFVALLTVAGLFTAASARADVAPPRPADLDCRRGTVPTVPEVDPDARDPLGRPVQPWPYCAPSECTSDADCDGGRVCSAEPIALCVQEHEDGRRTARRRGCEPDGTCLNMESTCETSRRCVTPDDEGADDEGEGQAEVDTDAPEESEARAEADRGDPSGDEAAPARPPQAAGCACHAVADRRSAPLGLVLLGVVWLAARRRR